MTRRPQKPAVAQVRGSALKLLVVFNSPQLEHTPPPSQRKQLLSSYTAQAQSDLRSKPPTQIPQTQHNTNHNGPSKGVPRDAARVRQGRPPVHHQVQQAYVLTLCPRRSPTLASKMKEAKRESSEWAYKNTCARTRHEQCARKPTHLHLLSLSH
jgi:hypothetical protein